MKDIEMFNLVKDARDNFGIKCAKYTGALTVEVIKNELEKQGIRTSPRDAFIKGLNIEIDLIIPRKGVEPKHGVHYQPQDVLAVLEIKNAGSFGEQTIRTVKNNFQRVHGLNNKIYCAYVTLSERASYPWAVTDANLGFPAFTLTWHSGSGKKFTVTPTGDWDKLIEKLREIVHSSY